MWQNLIGQERVKNILKNILSSGRVSHSYIFYGKSGIGKDAAAIEIAKYLNCENPDIERGACDKCKSCKDVQSLKSMLLKFITALPTGKDDDENSVLQSLEKADYENYLSEIEIKSENPYHKISLEKANFIRISSIREIKDLIYLTGSDNRTKVFLISDADNMNPQSANALLKILEEPPKNSLLILTTSKLNSLLPTIIGRCQKIHFDSISKENVIKYIKTLQPEFSESQLNFYAELADGSVSKAQNILHGSYDELRKKVLVLLRNLVTMNTIKAGFDIDFVTGKKDKERVRQFLILMQIWIRDVLYKRSGTDELVINKDEMESISKFAQRYNSDYFEIINLLENAINDIDYNVNLELMLFNLFVKIRELILAGEVKPMKV
ncbi:MAG: AAA family ATPase [Ignavibacteria bacterium]|nr:AAA family ATPase [Ignavibacteria bacterium]